MRSYILGKFRLTTTRRVSPIRVGLGGKTILLDDRCDLSARIDGLGFDFTGYLVDEFCETEHGPIDGVIGAFAMEEWMIKLDP